VGNDTEVENYLKEIQLNHSNLHQASWWMLKEHRQSLDAIGALDQMKLIMSALFNIRRNIRDLQEDQVDTSINNTALGNLDTLINRMVDQQIEQIEGFLSEFDQSLHESLQPIVDRLADSKRRAGDEFKDKFTFNN